MTSERLSDFQCATHRLFEILEEQQRHAVTGRQSNQFIFRFGSAKAIGATDNAIQFLKRLDLIIDQQL